MLAEALARGEARHSAVKRNRAAIEEIREVYRRSGGADAAALARGAGGGVREDARSA